MIKDTIKEIPEMWLSWRKQHLLLTLEQIPGCFHCGEFSLPLPACLGLKAGQRRFVFSLFFSNCSWSSFSKKQGDHFPFAFRADQTIFLMSLAKGWGDSVAIDAGNAGTMLVIPCSCGKLYRDCNYLYSYCLLIQIWSQERKSLSCFLRKESWCPKRLDKLLCRQSGVWPLS